MAEVPSEDNLTLNFGPKEPVHCWKKLQPCEEFVGAKRSKQTLVSWGDGLYIFGGDNGKRMLNDFLVFHIGEGSWARVVYTGTPPAPRYHHSAVVFNNSMFIFGGYTGDINSNSNLHNKNDLFEYKFKSSQWLEWKDVITGPLPPARSAHGSIVYDNKLWIFAGYDGHARLNDLWMIDLTDVHPHWIQVNQTGDHPPTCCNFPTAVVDNSMYVFSGQSGAKITNHLYEFKFLEQRWVRIPTEHLLRGAPAPPQRRYGHTMVAHNRQLYVFGGAVEGTLQSELHCYDVDSRSWSIIQPVDGSQSPSGRLFHSGAVCDNAMYIFGGTLDAAATRSGEMYRFQFSSYPKCTLINDFAKLLENEQFCDVEFLLGESKDVLSAHSVVVAARSPFLHEKIMGVHKQTSTQQSPSFIHDKPLVVTLPQATMEVFKMALHFMYTDRIHPSLESTSREGMSSEQMLLMMDVYKLSLLLKIKRLEMLCVQYIQASINEENVLLVLENACELRLCSLKDYCLKFIVRESSFKTIVMSSKFENIEQNLMVEIIRRQQSCIRSRPTSPDFSHEDEQSIPSSLQDDLRDFLQSEIGKNYADVFLEVGEVMVPAHKPVLAARCAYFEAMFRSFMPKDHLVKITFGKIIPTQQAFHSLMRYIYCGDTVMPPEDALYLFAAPDFFGFSNQRLQVYCKYMLEEKVSVDNILDIFEAADAIKMQEVKAHILSLIVNDFGAIIKQAHFRTLKRELLLDILDTLAAKMYQK